MLEWILLNIFSLKLKGPPNLKKCIFFFTPASIFIVSIWILSQICLLGHSFNRSNALWLGLESLNFYIATMPGLLIKVRMLSSSLLYQRWVPNFCVKITLNISAFPYTALGQSLIHISEPTSLL